MKFDFVIGNPPYQDNTLGDNETYAPPIYHLFMDAAFTASDKVELINQLVSCLMQEVRLSHGTLKG